MRSTPPFSTTNDNDSDYDDYHDDFDDNFDNFDNIDDNFDNVDENIDNMTFFMTTYLCKLTAKPFIFLASGVQIIKTLVKVSYFRGVLKNKKRLSSP